MNSRQIIRHFILENFLFTDDSTAIDDDASLLEQGIIDSLGALEIALFVQKSFGFTVEVAEMLPQNLDSVNNLVAFVDRKRKGVDRASHICATAPALAAG